MIATDYYETFNKPNVTLADVRTNALATFTETGVEFVDGSTYDFDVLVLATGFDSFTGGAFTQIDITGRDGRKLAEEWTHQVRPPTWGGCRPPDSRTWCWSPMSAARRCWRT